MDERLLRENPSVAVWWHLVRSFILIARECDRVLAHWGLTSPQLGVLACVRDAGGRLPVTQIGERMLVRCPSITGMVDRLERQGLVVRERGTGDRRVVLVHITEPGRQVLEEAHQALVSRVTEILAFMDAGEQRELADQLGRILLHLKEGMAS